MTPRILLAVVAFAGLLGLPASAQQYPSRPVRIVVPIPPGEAPDA